VTVRHALLASAALALAGAVLALAGYPPPNVASGPSRPPPNVAPVPSRRPANVASAPDRPPAKTCTAPAPTTPGGYAALFAHLPVAEWGAGDTGLTVPFGQRSVWLFGDTMSARPHGFVHSSAIVQTGGCLTVSHAGAQLLPNDDAQHIYWIESARAVDPAHLAVVARSTVLSGTCPWCFHDGGVDRTALVSVSTGGDLTFVRWTSQARTPSPDPGPMLDCEAPAPPRPGHFCYARHVHPELLLAGGQVLVTTSQGWDDGRQHPFADYRLILSAERSAPGAHPSRPAGR
jgi:hypothetical protein